MDLQYSGDETLGESFCKDLKTLKDVLLIREIFSKKASTSNLVSKVFIKMILICMNEKYRRNYLNEIGDIYHSPS